MRYLINMIFVTTLFSASTFAQMKKMGDVSLFNKNLEQTAKEIVSIESDFTQVKHLDIFNSDVTSKGKFYYKYNNKIRLDYYNPISYIIVINNDKLKTVSNGKKTVVSLGTNKTMKEMQGMLSACMSGDISQLSSDYELNYQEDVKYYLVIVTPKSKVVREYIKDFHIYFDKKDMSVDKLRISENATDYTDYLFTNKKFNSLQNDEKFSVN